MDKKIEKTFDCIEMKRKSQERIYNETKGMTPEERLDYFKQRVENGPFAKLFKRESVSKEQ